MIRITDDVFDIASRLREIDERYVVFYNPRKKRYELHLEEYGRTSFTLVLPFLDARAVEHCRKTRVERQRQLAEEIERENLKSEQEQIRQSKRRAEEMTEELLSSGRRQK